MNRRERVNYMYQQLTRQNIVDLFHFRIYESFINIQSAYREKPKRANIDKIWYGDNYMSLVIIVCSSKEIFLQYFQEILKRILALVWKQLSSDMSYKIIYHSAKSSRHVYTQYYWYFHTYHNNIETEIVNKCNYQKKC